MGSLYDSRAEMLNLKSGDVLSNRGLFYAEATIKDLLIYLSYLYMSNQNQIL